MIVAREHIPVIWRDIEAHVDAALEKAHGEFDRYDVLQYLMAGEFQLWVPDDLSGICVTRVLSYPRYTAVRVVLFAGKGALGTWAVPMIERVEEWARGMGCKRLEEMGRDGWAKVGQKHGWQEASRLMVKELI